MDGPGLAAVAIGSIMTYAGVKGISIPAAVQSIVQGKSPVDLPQTAAIGTPTSSSAADGSSTSGGGTIVSGGSAQATLQATAATFGWTGDQWQALQQIETHEAGWNPKAKNPSSGALGLAQALGHGNGSATAGTLGNEYGGNGLSDAQAKAANSGDAGAQSLWMCNYIKGRYGDPVKAWSFWQSHRWY